MASHLGNMDTTFVASKDLMPRRCRVRGKGEKDGQRSFPGHLDKESLRERDRDRFSEPRERELVSSEFLFELG